MNIKGQHRSFRLPPPRAVVGNVDHTPWDMDHVWHDLPDPTGPSPFRLDLADVLAPAEIAKMKDTMVFHTAGDSGAIRGDYQAQVAGLLETDAASTGAKFFYHLGDVVYDYGEDKEYPSQFYEIYKDYPGAMFAIPGNHDGARYPNGPDSLDGFITNFCATKPAMPPSLERTGSHYGRDTMTQPNCYWTLNTPQCTIVGLYTNVPSGGDVREPQVSWFTNELAQAPAGKPLIVAMHHPMLSIAVGSHAGSRAMESLMTAACTAAKRVPQLVLCGHAHNYQRFDTTFLKKPCTFVVAGVGGHGKDKFINAVANGTVIPHGFPVKLQYSTDRHVGFLRVAITAGKLQCDYVAVGEPAPLDSFTI